ncbi:MAG: hypothetical protein PF904_13795 [Kiritimatiellae bacterium]|nr:hypothetical protein [Kiritimatiellia bacterium]
MKGGSESAEKNGGDGGCLNKVVENLSGILTKDLILIIMNALNELVLICAGSSQLGCGYGTTPSKVAQPQ